MSAIIMILFCFIGLVGIFAIGLWLRNAKTPPQEASNLKGIELFEHVSPSELSEIAELVLVQHISKGTTIIKESAGDHALYFIVSGTVNILKSGSVHESLLKTIGAGEFLGEIAFLTGRNRIASAITVEDSVVLKFHMKDFSRLTKKVPKLESLVWDACFRHTIMLLIAEYPELRGLSSDDRDRWIDQLKQFGPTKDATVVDDQTCWLTVIEGKIKIGTHVHEAPKLIRTYPGDEIVPLGQARYGILESATKALSFMPPA